MLKTFYFVDILWKKKKKLSTLKLIKKHNILKFTVVKF